VSLCRSFEGAIAALGAPLVGAIAQNVFNYKTVDQTGACEAGKPRDQAGEIGQNHRNAEALGNAMLVCMLVPWVLCFLIYTLLHWTYPKDKAAVQIQRRLSDGVVSRQSLTRTASQRSE
jgi:hypothetical protein